MKQKVAMVAALVAVACCVFSGDLWGRQQAQIAPRVIYDSYHDTSLPVSEYSMEVPQGGRRHEVEHPRPRRILASATVPVADRAEQSLLLPPVSARIGLNFDGIPNSANGQSLEGVPSDSNLAVGATQVVETINTAYEVYDKAGKSVFGPQQISALFTGLPGLCGQGVHSFNYTDPIVLYDQMANRWIITIIAADSNFVVGNECIAVSESSDATGRYHRYVYKFGSNVFNDYDKLSVWPDAFYASYNVFVPRGYLGAQACAYDRNAMLSGAGAKAICFTKTTEYSFLPSNVDGATLPSSGEPSFFLDLFSATSLHLFRFHADFAVPQNSTFEGPIRIPVKAFTMACGGGVCIPQPNTVRKLDSLGDRLMFRLAYRNFGDHESLVVNHSVQTTKAASGIRWYEIRDPNGVPTVFQQGTFTSLDNSLWMASLAMDKVGNMALGFSESNASSLYPSVAFTGRVPGDTANTMESLKTIFSAQGSETDTNRWGDYTSMLIDPSDDCTFWYVDQYIPTTGSGINFRTRVATLKFPTCQ